MPAEIWTLYWLTLLDPFLSQIYFTPFIAVVALFLFTRSVSAGTLDDIRVLPNAEQILWGAFVYRWGTFLILFFLGQRIFNILLCLGGYWFSEPSMYPVVAANSGTLKLGFTSEQDTTSLLGWIFTVIIAWLRLIADTLQLPALFIFSCVGLVLFKSRLVGLVIICPLLKLLDYYVWRPFYEISGFLRLVPLIRADIAAICAGFILVLVAVLAYIYINKTGGFLRQAGLAGHLAVPRTRS